MSRAVGDRLRIIRGKISQKVFAGKINVPFRTYRRYEAGESTIPSDIVRDIASVCHASAEWILTGKEPFSETSDESLEEKKQSYGSRRRKNNLSTRARSVLLSYYQPICAHCGFGIQSILEVSHIVPSFKGGKAEPDNLILLCPNCHQMVHKGLISEESLRESRERVKLTKRQNKQPSMKS